MRIELTRPWPRVRVGDRLSYGGNQQWFPDENFRLCGCGVIACADTLLYLTGRTEMTRDDYLRYVDSLRKYFPLIPRRGVDGVRLAVGFNACMRKNGMGVRAGWSASGTKFWNRLSAQLEHDLPAIIAVGPNFPRVWGMERLPLYCRTADETYAEAERTKGHFLTVTGLDDKWMRASSWGRELYIERGAYGSYMRRQGAVFTNLLSMEKKNR